MDTDNSVINKDPKNNDDGALDDDNLLSLLDSQVHQLGASPWDTVSHSNNNVIVATKKRSVSPLYSRGHEDKANFIQLLKSLPANDYHTVVAMANALEMKLTTFRRKAKRHSVNLEDFGLVKKPEAEKITSEAHFIQLLADLPAADDFHTVAAMANALEMPRTTLLLQAKRNEINLEDFLVKKITSEAHFIELLKKSTSR